MRCLRCRYSRFKSGTLHCGMVGSGVIDGKISYEIPEGNPSGISEEISCVILGGIPFKISGENY